MTGNLGGIGTGLPMSALNFPSTGGQATDGSFTYSANGHIYAWDGEKWTANVIPGDGGASVTVSASAPSQAEQGDLWFDSVEGRTYLYYADTDSSQWVDASPSGADGGDGGGGVSISETAPENPEDGDLWYNTGDGRTYVYYTDTDSSQWVNASPPGTPSLATVATSGSYSDLSNTPSPAITTTATSTTGTVQTSSTGTVNGSTTYTNPDTSSAYTIFDQNGAGVKFAAGGILDMGGGDATYEAGLTAIMAMSAGDKFTVQWAGGTGEYTYSGHTQNLDDLEVFHSARTVSGTFIEEVPFAILSEYTATTITGDNNPIWDDTKAAVSIGGVGFSTDDWTVSGTSATHNSATPSITVGATIEQADQEHSLGKAGHDKNSLTLQGADSELILGDSTDQTKIVAEGTSEFNGGVEVVDTLTIKHLDTYSSGQVLRPDWSLSAGSEYSIYITNSDFVETVPSGNPTRYNLFIGHEAGKNRESTIQESIFIGYRAGRGNTSTLPSYRNTIIGHEAGLYLEGGSDNVALGVDALKANTQASDAPLYNVALGNATMLTITTGDKNTATGHQAGYYITSGVNNLLLGYRAGYSSSPSGTINTQSNRVCLGDNNITHIYCADTTISSSDGRDKAEVSDCTMGLSFVNALRPVTYVWDKRSWYLPEEPDEDDPAYENFVMPSLTDMVPDGTHKKTSVHVGFIAQEVQAVELEHGYGHNDDDSLVISENAEGTAMGVKYERMVPILVNAIKELSAKNEELLARIEALES